MEGPRGFEGFSLRPASLRVRSLGCLTLGDFEMVVVRRFRSLGISTSYSSHRLLRV